MATEATDAAAASRFCYVTKEDSPFGVGIMLGQVAMLCLLSVTSYGPPARELTEATRQEIFRAALAHVRKECNFAVPFTAATRVQADPVRLSDLPDFSLSSTAARRLFDGAEAGADVRALLKRLQEPGRAWSVAPGKDRPAVLPKEQIREAAGRRFILRLTDILELSPTDCVVGVFVEQAGRARAECLIHFRLDGVKWRAVGSVDAPDFLGARGELSEPQKQSAGAAVEWVLSRRPDLPTPAGKHWRVSDHTLQWNVGAFAPCSDGASGRKGIDRGLYEAHVRENARVAKVAGLAGKDFDLKPVSHAEVVEMLLPGFKAFAAKYPKSAGVVWVSRPALTDDGRDAMVRVYVKKWVDWGECHLVHLRKADDGRWLHKDSWLESSE